MKKFFALLIAGILLLGCTVPAFADLGEPEFDNWFVVCGLAGFDFTEQVPDYENNTSTTVHDHLEPGEKLQVYDYWEEDGTYLLIISNEDHASKGTMFVHVTESQLNNNFITLNKTLGPEVGKKLDQAVNCTVTADPGVVLRQGPAKTFPKYTTIPKNTALTYQYTYAYGGYNWGYVTYKGQSGWTCIDYTKETAAQTTAPSTTAPTTAPTTTAAPSTDATTVIDGANAAQNNAAADTTAATDTAKKETKDGLFGGMSKTTIIILFCCFAAIVLSIVGIAVLLVLKKKK